MLVLFEVLYKCFGMSKWHGADDSRIAKSRN